MTAATKIQWRVQCRKSRTHKWVNKGLFETRERAREVCKAYRESFTTETWVGGKEHEPFDFGNTRVIRYVKGSK